MINCNLTDYNTFQINMRIEGKNFQVKKRELLELQNNNPKNRIVEEFLMQCKRYLKVDIDMDMNDAQRGLFHFKNGCF